MGANLEWREKIGIENYGEFLAEIAQKDSLMNNALESLVGYRHGVSKEGRPVWIARILDTLWPERIGEMYSDNRVFLHELELLQAKESEHHHFVVVPELMRQKKIPDHRHISIIDLIGVSPKLIKSNLGRTAVKMMIKFEDNHYPDSSHKVFLINAPKAFGNFWSMIKRILSKSVTSKIAVFGNDISPLFEVINKAELPSCIGGTSPFKLGDHPDVK